MTVIIRTVIEKVIIRNLLAVNTNFFFFIILSNQIVCFLKGRHIDTCELTLHFIKKYDVVKQGKFLTPAVIPVYFRQGKLGEFEHSA